jgi:hypothetical protein
MSEGVVTFWHLWDMDEKMKYWCVVSSRWKIGKVSGFDGGGFSMHIIGFFAANLTQKRIFPTM